MKTNHKDASDVSTKQTVALVAATLMSAGQIGINQLDDAIAKAKELVKKAGL